MGHTTDEAGPVADFDQFYTATAKRMVAVVYAVTGDLGEAEDAVQEAYARAWQRWARLTEEGDPAPWVRTVALRLAVSHWRKARNRMRAHFRHGPPQDAPALAPDRVALVAALRALGDDQRTAVVMHHLLDLPVEEIARETGVSSAAVRTRLSRGRKALGVRLRDEPDDPGDPGERRPGPLARHRPGGPGDSQGDDPPDRPAGPPAPARSGRPAGTVAPQHAPHPQHADHRAPRLRLRTEEVPLHG